MTTVRPQRVEIDDDLEPGARPFQIRGRTVGSDPRTIGLQELLEENQQLRQRLNSLPVIEQSKGLLMLRYGLDSATAFKLLQRWSSRTNLKLRHISHLLVDAANRGAQPEPTPDQASVEPTLDGIIAWLESDAPTN